jgi:hypothetical protein
MTTRSHRLLDVVRTRLIVAATSPVAPANRRRRAEKPVVVPWFPYYLVFAPSRAGGGD